MKKIALAIFVILGAGMLVYYYYPLKPIELVINEKSIELKAPAMIEEEVLLFPAEQICQELGFDTGWDSENQILAAELGEYRIEMPVGSKLITVDDESLVWDFPLTIIDEVIYAPIVPLSDAVGAIVEWSESERVVVITTPQEFDPKEEGEQAGPLLHVAHPPEEQVNYYADSLYVFGTTRSYAQIDVSVNGEPVDIIDRRTGNFLTMVDIPRGEEFVITVEATDGNETTMVERVVLYPEGLQTMPEEPLALHPNHVLPAMNQVLNPGDILRIAARGSPGAEAYYQIGGADPVKMTELTYPTGPVGRGGIYTAVYTVGEKDAPESGISDFFPIMVTLTRGEEVVHRELPGKVAFFSELPYKMLEVKEERALGFSGWFRLINDSYYQLYSATRGGAGYPDSIASYLTPGTRFKAVGLSGDYYRVKLTGSDTYMLHKDAVRELEDLDSPEPLLSGLGLAEDADQVRLYLQAEDRFPFLISSGTNQLEVKMYGLMKGEDFYLPQIVGSVEELTLEAAGGLSEALVLSVKLDTSFTGFTPSWEDTELVLEFAKPRKVSEENPLQGKTIAVDPGHGGEDPGAPGPGDLHEKDVVLQMSLHLRDMLIEAGANVIMTRTEDIDVDLYDRPKAEYLDEIDFFISVHANAHAQGANAVDLHGIMVLYNHDHNEKLAHIMLETVSSEMGLPAMSAWRRNIAVTRHTQFPTVLVEAGYMMHPEDNWYIFHPRGQEAFAAAMKEGIKAYFLSLDN